MRIFLPKLFVCLLLIMGWSNVSGQQLEEVNVNLQPRQAPQISSIHAPMRTACTLDTVGYTLGKATGLRAISINNATSANGAAQYFDIPQPITFSGMRFYAWSSSLPVVNVTVSIFTAGNDSFPTGTALATATVPVDSAFGSGALSVLEKEFTFSSPVTVTQPIVIVIENNSANNIALACSDYTANPADGLGEDLASARIGTTWIKGSGLNVGGNPFDADWLIEPFATYDLTAAFTPNPNCLTSPGTVTFTNNSSPVMTNRMYNLATFLGISRAGFTWDFGDGSATVNAVDTTHNYTAAGTYTINLKDTLFGWTNTCVHDTSVTIGAPPAAAYTQNVSGLTATFSDGSSGSPTGWLWDFGDGNTSTQQSPSHTYANSGTYTVCLTVTSNCGSDSTCSTVNAISCNGPTASFTSSSNELTATFTDGSTTTGNASWFWNFGDGTTSSVPSPMHTYAAAGTYQVCLIVNDSCGVDTTCNTVVITCTMPMAGFSAGGGGFSVQFSNGSSDATSYMWDFGDGSTSNDSTPSHLYSAAGTYYVCLMATNICGTDTFCDSVSVPVVGIRDGLLDGRVNAFPNPTSGQLNVSIDMFNPDDLEVSIHNLLGQQLFISRLEGVMSEKMIFDLSTLENGMYILKVSGESGELNRRIILNR